MSVTPSNAGRRQLLLIALVFFAPLVVAWLMYLGVIDWRPTSSSAHGELFDPALSLPPHEPEYLNKIYPDDFLRERWTLAYVGMTDCNSHCEQTLLVMRQVRMSLGKYADRIGLAAILPQDGRFPDALYPAFPNMEIVRAGSLAQVILASHQAQPGEWIYIIDPLGNLVMRFSNAADPRAIYNDLKRLLKLSRIG
ncbi:MAG: hypothetical protein HKN70_05595 [Gammaproteobacteria bacterium]|nr:hypothetical protein [Gammaproteobacteria bacterium]